MPKKDTKRDENQLNFFSFNRGGEIKNQEGKGVVITPKERGKEKNNCF